MLAGWPCAVEPPLSSIRNSYLPVLSEGAVTTCRPVMLDVPLAAALLMTALQSIFGHQWAKSIASV